MQKRVSQPVQRYEPKELPTDDYDEDEYDPDDIDSVDSGKEQPDTSDEEFVAEEEEESDEEIAYEPVKATQRVIKYNDKYVLGVFIGNKLVDTIPIEVETSKPQESQPEQPKP